MACESGVRLSPFAPKSTTLKTEELRATGGSALVPTLPRPNRPSPRSLSQQKPASRHVHGGLYHFAEWKAKPIREAVAHARCARLVESCPACVRMALGLCVRASTKDSAGRVNRASVSVAALSL